MAQYQFLDELVKEYLLFRGFTLTLKTFDQDLKLEKEKGFRVDRILEQMNHHISTFDLIGLTDLWKHFDLRIFSKLDTAKLTAVKKLENSVLKLYVINCIQNKQPDKLREFFEKMTSELQMQTEWKDWFSLPYLKDPQDNPAFSIYFSRNWQDTLTLSLHNFFALCFHSLPPPRLADYQKTAARIRVLKDEIRSLKVKMAQAGLDEDPNLATGNLRFFEPPPNQEIMDDFFLIAQEAEKTESQVKSIKNFLRNFTGQSEKKKSPKSQSRSSSISRQAPTTLSVSKPPLKRVTPNIKRESLAQLSGQSWTEEEGSGGRQELQAAGQAGEEEVSGGRQGAQAAEQGGEDTGDDSATEQGLSSLLATPGTPGTRYLLLGQEEFHEHRSAVCCVEVSSGGLIATADASGVIKVWVPASSTPPTTIATFISASPITSLAWVDERKILYGTNTGQIRLCDVEEKCLVVENTSSVMAGQSVTVLACSPSLATFFCCSQLKAVLVNTKTFTVERDLTQECEKVTAAKYNHNGSLIAYGREDGKLGLTDLNRGEILSSWLGHDNPIASVAFCKDETSVWSLAMDGSLLKSSLIRPGERMWGGKLLLPPSRVPPCFSISPDGEHVLSGTDSGGVVYRMGESGLVKILGLRGEHPVTAVAWIPGECGPTLTAGLDGVVKISTLLSQ